MLSVVTLWIVFTVNFLALGVVWLYVARSYPNFEAARFWAAGAFLASFGSAISILREFVPSLLPLLIAATMVIAACTLISAGVERFYNLSVNWRRHSGLVACCFLGMSFFIWQQNSMLRILIFSAGISLAIGTTVQLVLWQPAATRNPGAQLAGLIGGVLIGTIMLRAVLLLLYHGPDANLVHFNPFQATIVLALVFLSVAWNFGFLLMAIDRLRAEVEELALVDDLTGVANRRQLLSRLKEECARSNRTMEPFALLLIDLDRFKAINDNYGHAAGDACLRLFARTLQRRLRTGDLLSRLGGDEFCAVLPSTTLYEAELVARQLVETSRASEMSWHGISVTLTTSIGVAQWRPDIGGLSQNLLEEADQALYAAKSDGRNCYTIAGPAVFERQMLATA